MQHVIVLLLQVYQPDCCCTTVYVVDGRVLWQLRTVRRGTDVLARYSEVWKRRPCYSFVLEVCRDVL